MKNLFYLLLCFLILTACNRPQKLLEKGKDEKAFQTSLTRLQRGKIKTKNLTVFEQAFNNLNARDANVVSNLKAEGHPKLWLDIYDLSLDIEKRQRKSEEVNQRLHRKGHYLDLNWYPSDELMDESRSNVALFYYAKAQELIPLARGGDKKAARDAYYLLEESQKYQANFKDVDELENEMSRLGTTNIVLEPLETDLRFKDSDRLFNSFLNRQKFPKRKKWKVFHLIAPKDVEVDYELAFYFDDMHDSGELVRTENCSNTKRIETGTRTERVWSQSDSAYVDVITTLYEEVSVTVQTFHQSKIVSLKLFCEVVDAKSGDLIDDFKIYNSDCWTNSFSRIRGDRRALGTCSTFGGCEQSPPSTFGTWLNLASGLGNNFYKKADKIIY